MQQISNDDLLAELLRRTGQHAPVEPAATGKEWTEDDQRAATIRERAEQVRERAEQVRERAERRERKPPTRVWAASRLIPAWGHDAAQWIVQHRTIAHWRIMAWVMSSMLFLAGCAMLFGNGYTTIQGIRVPLAAMGVPVATTGIPALVWWTIPLVMTIIEIFGKHMGGFRMAWYPMILFDGASTSVYLCYAIINLITFFGHQYNFYMVVGVGSTLGLCLAVIAEQIFLTSLAVLYAVATGRE